MSWEPALVSDGRGGFVRNPRRTEEEVEEPPPLPASADDEEEGEISASGVQRPNGNPRPRFGGGRGPGNNNSRPPFPGGRHRHHGSFSGAPGNLPPPGGNNFGPPPFVKREGNFGGRSGFQGRPGSDFRNEPPPFFDGPPPRDFRGDGAPTGGRDSAPFRNISDGPRGDLRINNSGGPLPFRSDEPPPVFRDRGGPPDPARDFRDGPPREPQFGGPPPPQRPAFREGKPLRGVERNRSAGGASPFAGRPAEAGRDGSFGAMAGGSSGRDTAFGPRGMGALSRGDPIKEGPFRPKSGDMSGAPRDRIRDGSFGPRQGDIGGPPREVPRDGTFGPRGGDMGGPLPRDTGRDSLFGFRGVDSGAPSRDPIREGSFRPRVADVGMPPRDLAREGSFGPRSGDIGAPPRELGRDGPFGTRSDEIGGPIRDSGRDSAFGPRGADVVGPSRESGSHGSGPPSSRAGPLQHRDIVSAPTHPLYRGDGQRETSFSDLAGPPPPRDRPFRDEPRSRVGSQGPPGPSPNSIPNPIGNPPSDPRRPTDPRRRSAQDLGCISPGLHQVASDAPPDGPPDGPLLPSPQPGRRLGSYSSLADSSAMPPILVNSQPPLSGNDGGLGFRSPVGRRSQAESSRNDRGGDHFNTTGSQRPSWSAAPQRGGLGSSSRPSGPPIKAPGCNSNAPIGSHGGHGIPPMAPSLSSRGHQSLNSRDPRLKGNDKPGDIRLDTNLSAPAGGLGGPFRKKSFPDVQESTDAFGRARKHMNRASPPRTINIRSFPVSPRNDLAEGTLERTISDPTTATAAEQPTQPKPGALPPLLTSALGEGEVIQRAETAVLHLSEVVGDKNVKAEGNELSELPAKQMIMSAVTEIERLIKEAQREVEECEGNKKEALKAEAEHLELEKKRQSEAETRHEEEQKTRLEEENKVKEKLRFEGLKQAIADGQEKLSLARQTLQEECEQKIHKAKQDRRRQLEEDLSMQISKSEQSFDKDVAKAKSFVEKAKSSVARVESKLATAQSAYDSLMEGVQGGPTGKADQARGGPTSTRTASLVEQILAENNRRSAEVQALGFSMISENDQLSSEETPTEDSEGPTDPLFGKTCEEWSVLVKQITGISDAIYSEPSEAPYFQQHERSHALLAPAVKECIRDQRKRLVDEWTVLAEEYEVRKRLYEKQQKKLAKKAQRGSVSVSRKSILAGDKESSNSTNSAGQGIDRGNILESGSRTSSNPYRRARRGNEVRSEYEQEQIIAEIAAREAMEKRIAHGGSKLPRQISRLERGMTGSYVKTFTSHKVDDPLKEAEEAKMNNVWTDMEKCIFLDRFLQFPKDFRRIASFLRNKTTKDCIAFYYDSKQTVPYKGALKEHIMRRRRKGDYQIWIASVQAAISVGATVSAGEDEEKPVLFTLPSSDKTYRTWSLHPIRRPVLDGMPIDEGAASGYEGEVRSEESKWKSRKRGRDPLFSLDEEQTKFLRTTSQESVSGVAREKVSLSEEERVSLSEEEKAAIEPAPELAPGLAPEPTSAPTPATAIATAPVPIPGPAVEAEETREQSMPPTSARKAPQKWTAAEKRIFAETLEQYGRDWAKLAEAVGTKNEKQIKNFYYDWKKGKSRPSSEKKANKKDKISKKKEEVTKKNFTPNVEKKRALEIEAVTEARSEKKGLPPLPEQPDKREMQQQQVESTGQAPALTGLRAQAEAVAREQEVAAAAADAARRRIEIPDNNASANVDYGGGNPELLQHLLNQQLQQQQHSHAPQSALQQLLSQQHVQREQQLNQLSLEEARRLLDHHQNPRGPVLSNMLNPQWLGAQQMLQGQSGLSSHAIAAALRGENNALSGGPGNVGELQRILQMQHAQGLGMPNRQNHLASLLLGGGGDMGGTSASNNLSNALLQQLASRGSGAGQPSEHDHLSSLANAQNILGYSGGAGGAGTSNLANALYRQPGGGSIDSGGVSDTLSLLARSMQQRGDGSPHGFGRLHDRSDGSGRCN